ncbi:MAG TPA: hypothetical protein VG941_01450 [Candidatus Paceibacterota bacterium]|nr:hypothetical protein [Candidatus Paceibacterota bacterium]
MRTSAVYRRCLETIDTFGVTVAQHLEGGMILHHSHRNGDLRHSSGSYSEVKMSGLSNGPIIEEGQLIRSLEDSHPAGKNYIFICYTNRGSWRGELKNLPLRIFKARGGRGLEEFLVAHTKVAYLVPAGLLYSVYEYELAQGRVRTYPMKTGPKTYFRMRFPLLNSLVTGPGFSELGISSGAYRVSTAQRTIRIHQARLLLWVHRIIEAKNDKRYFI